MFLAGGTGTRVMRGIIIMNLIIKPPPHLTEKEEEWKVRTAKRGRSAGLAWWLRRWAGKREGRRFDSL